MRTLWIVRTLTIATGKLKTNKFTDILEANNFTKTANTVEGQIAQVVGIEVS